MKTPERFDRDLRYAKRDIKRWHTIKYQMENITVKGELLFELESKQQWVNRVPNILPDKTRAGEQWIWVDSNGNVFECGADFSAAEKAATYPCKVYKLQSVAVANER